jgi:hypothetical protein
MAEMIVKLGLDRSDFVAGMDAAASKTGGVSAALSSVQNEANAAGKAIQAAGNSGGAFDGLKSKLTSVGSSFGSLGTSLLGVFGGGALVAGIGSIGSAFGEILNGAREADDAADSLSISLAKAGLSGAELEAEQKRLGAVAKQTANDFAIPTNEVAKLQAKITGFSGATGDQLDELTQFSLGAANALQMPAESVAKLLGKAADPEATAKLKSLGIQFDANATAAEKMEIIQRKLGPTIDATKASTQDAIGTFDRISISIKEFTIDLASGLFDVIGQILSSLSPFVTAFKSAFDGIGGGLGDFMTSLKSTVADVLTSIQPVITFLADKVAGGLLLAFTVVKTQVTLAFNIVKSVFSSVLDAVRPLIDQFTGLGASTFSFSDIVKQIAPIIEDFGGVLAQVGKIVVEIVLTPLKMLFQIIASGVGFVTSLFSSTQELTGATKESGEAAGKSSTFFEKVHNVMVTLQGVIGGAAAAFKFLTAQVGQLFDALVNLNFGKIKDIISGTVSGTMDAFAKGQADAIQANSNLLSQAKALDEEVAKLGAEKDKAKREQMRQELVAKQANLQSQLESERSSNRISISDATETQKILSDLFAKTNRKAKPVSTASEAGLGETKDIKDELAKQRAEIEAAKREADEKSIADENERAIAALQNQYAEKITKVKEGNRKIQEDESISASQRREYAANSADQIIAIEKEMQGALKILRDKQAEDAQKRNEETLKKEKERQEKADKAQRDSFMAAMEFEKFAKAKSDEDRKKTEEQNTADRLAINKRFADALEQLRKNAAAALLKNADATDALNKEEEALTLSLRRREITYEEYSKRLLDIDKRRSSEQALVQEVGSSALSQNVQAFVSTTNELVSAELSKMSTEFFANFDKSAASGTASLEDLGTAAATQFGAMVISGQSAGNALKELSSTVVGKLIDMYVAPVIMSTLSFLGPLGLPVATALIASAKSLFASAIAGFQDGGYTGDGGTSSIAGVVHGQEFVHTADVTRRNRPLFEHLHRGGELSTWMVTTAGALQSPAVTAPSVSTYGIESRLDRLEMAIIKGNRKFESMRAVQMTVQHDPTLTIKTQSRNLEIRSARA